MPDPRLTVIAATEPGPTGRAATDPAQPGMAERQQEQRQRARRTALWVGGLAVLVYVAFILSGVLGS